MFYFNNDYNELAHERILKALHDHNYTQTPGYGKDPFCEKAKELLRSYFHCPNSDIYFFMAGTITNLTMIDHMLRPYEAIIATKKAHIHLHEAGSVEMTGHKILLAEDENGKILPESIERLVRLHSADDHMVLPRAVYVSNATELGTVYTKKELEAIHDVCAKHKLFLFLDGARLGAALASPYSDLKPEDLSAFCDAFYVGGTKNGALLGEALILLHSDLKKNFFRNMKGRGAVYAKGKVLGLEYLELFKDDLYMELAAHADRLAMKVEKDLKDLFHFAARVESNQIFLYLTEKECQNLQQKFGFEVQEETDPSQICIRLVTSWATPPEAVDELIHVLRSMRTS